MNLLKEIRESLLHLFFPHVCEGCGTDVLGESTLLCLRCAASLPATNFEKYPHNPVEKIFWGRLPVMNAAAQYYFSKESLIQHLLHQLKYKQNKEIGLQLGRMMGHTLAGSGRFGADALIPLPLFPARERKRGYNQAAVLCEGISEILHLPVLNHVITRPEQTETQTRKGRIERWKNMEGKFELSDIKAIEGKHIILVDDVITTGATLESCGQELLKAENLCLSVAALAYTTK